MTKALVIEVENSSNNWADLTTATMDVSGALGMLNDNGIPQPGGGAAGVGKCDIVLNNSDPSRPYSPEVTTANVKVGRRARVRYYGDSHGYCLRATRTGYAGGAQTHTVSTDQTAESASSLSFNTSATPQYQRAGVQFIELTQGGYLTTIRYREGSTGGTHNTVGQIYSVDDSDPNNLKLDTRLETATLASAARTARTEYDITMAGTTYLQPYTKYAVIIYTSGTSLLQVSISTGGSSYTGGYYAEVKFPNVATPTAYDYHNYDADMDVRLILSTVNSYFKTSVTNSFSIGDVWVLTWEARAPTDTRWNSDDVYMVTNAETGAVTTYNYTTEWASYSLSFTATASGTSIEPRFRANDENTSGGTTRGIEYRNFTLKKNGGSNLLSNPTFAGGSTTGWSAVNVAGATTTLEAIRDYTYIFNGEIEGIEPSPGSYGDFQSILRCVDNIDIYQKAQLTLSLQKNQTMSSIAASAVATLKDGKAIGHNFDTGATFILAADRYRKQKNYMYDVFKDLAMSEYGAVWCDRSGVLRLRGRNFFGAQPVVAASLTLDSGSATMTNRLFDIAKPSTSRNTILNKVTLTVNPRQTQSTGVIATTQEVIAIPHKGSDDRPGSYKFTLEFRDSSGNPIGADNVTTPPTALTDINVWTQDTSAGTVAGTNVTANRGTDWTDTYTVNATNIDCVFQNYTSADLFIAKGMQIRGDGVALFDPVTITKFDQDSIDAYQEREYKHDLPFYSNRAFADSLAGFIVYRRANPETSVASFGVTSRSDLASVDLLTLDLFDVVAITDSQTGLSSMKHQIIAIEFRFLPQLANWTQSLVFHLSRLAAVNYLILDDATYGKLDTGRLYI